MGERHSVHVQYIHFTEFHKSENKAIPATSAKLELYVFLLADMLKV